MIGLMRMGCIIVVAFGGILICAANPMIAFGLLAVAAGLAGLKDLHKNP